MNVGILGLGLIGGSLARAYAKAGHRVFACEKDTSILGFACLDVFCTISVLLWPSVQSHNIDFLAVELHSEMTSTVCYHAVGLFAYYLLYDLDG